MVRRLRARWAQRATRLGLLGIAASQHRGPVPDVSGTIEFEASFGTLHLDPDDPVITAGLLAVGEWEPGETALLGGHIRPGMTVVDVGAHVGYYTVLAGRLVGPRGLVVAFEPDPRNFDLLLANVWRNGLTNAVCLPWAISDRSGFTALHLAPSNTGDHRIYPVDEPRESVPVRAAALDDVLALKPPVDVLKVDVQGAEEAVVRGAERLLAASPSVLATVEFGQRELAAFGSEPRALLGYYRSLGFRVRVQHPERRGIEELTDDAILTESDEGLHVNLVLTRP